MPNNSSTGGFIAPAVAPAPLQGKLLLQFFQQLIVGITALDGTLVRPYWQTEPPTIPDAGVPWCAFKIAHRPSDEYPFVGCYPNVASYPGPGDYLQRHEALEILTTFYDTGSTGLDDSGGQADYYASLLRDGLAVPQNREPLFNAGMGLVRIGDVITVPILFKRRWQNRVDFDWMVRRQIDRLYPVDTLVGAEGNLYTDVGIGPLPFNN